MGHRSASRTPPPPVSREAFSLSIARSRYVRGEIEVEEFEQTVERVLRGASLAPLRPPPDSLRAVRR